MSEEKSGRKSLKYLIFLIIFLSLVEIFDTYTTLFPNVIVSKVQDEFLASETQVIADSIMSLAIAVASIGMYFVVVNQFLADLIGRRIMLFITVLGMGLASLFIFFTTNLIQYTSSLFFLYVFFSSDIWTIYISEESPKERRGLYLNLILVAGCIGAILVPVFRSIFITETSPITAWRSMTIFAFLAIPIAFLMLGIKETSKFKELKEFRKSDDFVKQSPFLNLKKPFDKQYRRQFIPILIMAFISGLNYIFIQMGESFLANNVNLEEGDVNIVVTIMSVSAICGYLITGVFVDKVGRKPLFYIYTILTPIAIFIVIIGVQSPDLALIAACIGAGLATITFYGLGIVNRLVSIEILPTDIRGTGTGWRSIISAIGITCGLLLNSVLNLIFGLGISFLIISLLLLINIPIIYRYIKETKGIELETV